MLPPGTCMRSAARTTSGPTSAQFVRQGPTLVFSPRSPWHRRNNGDQIAGSGHGHEITQHRDWRQVCITVNNRDSGRPECLDNSS